MEEMRFSVPAEGEGERVDSFVSRTAEGLSRAQVQRLCETGYILADGRAVAKNFRLKAGQLLSVLIPEPEPQAALPQNIGLDILYEDAHLLVVNKPKGMVVHPAAGNPDGTLVNALLYHCRGNLSGIGGVARPGIVHRLDKDTSGLLLVAKDDRTHRGLSSQIAAHSAARIYQAVVYGGFKADEGSVDAPIGRDPVRRKRMCVTARGGKPAVTDYRVVERFIGFTHLELRLHTGRTHQIRVHMAHIGHPVAGDPVYGPRKVMPGLCGQCLHAGEIRFTHPVTGLSMAFRAPLPDYFEKLVQKLRRGEG
jgi:23S rRNA pseudouridine1911/1915/1917 synthase